MAIHRISDFDPDYRNHFDEKDVKGLDLYVSNDKVGSVDDILVDDQGQIRYLIVHTGTWILGKKVLLPIGFARIDNNARRVYANNLTKAQVENLPEFTDDMAVDYDHEERVRGVYRSGMQTMPQDVTPGMMGAVDRPAAVTGNDMTAPMLDLDQGYVDYDRDTYSYEKEPNDMYALNEQNHPNLKLYEERLVADKTRQKTGEAVISKRIETETANATVEVDKERVVVNRVPVTGQTAVAPGEASFQAGEVSRVEVYEEVPEFRKEAFVREEVEVSKVVDHETATAQENLRREEIEINVEDRLTTESRN
jgi:uncharacterized protein (TIGR02271 family)